MGIFSKDKGKDKDEPAFPFLGDPEKDPAYKWRHEYGKEPSRQLKDKFPLTGSDRSMYALGEPENGFVVWTVISTESIKDKETYLSELNHMINTAEYERFRFEVKTISGNPYWVRKEPFSINDACTFHSLEKAGDREEFQAFLQDKIETTSFREGLLWRTYIVDNYSNAEGNMGSCICFGVHHAITDGIGLMKLCLLGTLGSAGDLYALFPFLKPGGAPKEDKAKSPALGSAEASSSAAQGNGSKAKEGDEKEVKAEGGAASSSQPPRPPRKKKSAVKKYKGMAKIGWKMTQGLHQTMYKNTLLSDRAGALKGKRPFKQHAVAWGKPITLKDLRTVSRAVGTTLNALVTSMGTGAMRRYLSARDDLHGRKHILASGPFPLVRKVNMNAEGEATGGEANGMGVVINRLPVGEANRVKRAKDIKKAVDDMKFSPEAWLTHLAVRHTGNIPRTLRNHLANSVGTRVTTGFSNIPGPGRPIYFCGLQFTDIFFVAPCWFQKGMGCSWTICSYNGVLTPAVMTNREIAPSPEELMLYFDEEWKEYQKLAEMADKA